MTTTTPEQRLADHPTPTPSDLDVEARVEALAERLFEALIGAAELCTIDIGDRLGLYAELDTIGAPVTATELANRLGLDERYVREWCDQQAISGLLVPTGGATAEAGTDEPRRYALAPGVREITLDPLSPAYLVPVARIPSCVGAILPRVAEAFATGAGVPYADYGPAAVEIQAAFNRPAFVHSLASEWIPAIPGLHERLADASRPAVVADVGCGVGYSSVELAKAYRTVTVYGYDADEASVARARRLAVDEGVADRVHFEVTEDGADPSRLFDVAFLFECLHDMAHPTEVLRRTRASLADGGYVVVMDERAADEFTAPGDVVERMFASFSVLWCLPQSRTDGESEALGTLLRPATVSRIATDAGFASTEVLPIEHPMFRFYQLNP